jgi:tetratricopeptide (TPR) repeat protein
MRYAPPSATGEVSMKLMITTAALALLAVPASAGAQVYGQYGTNGPQAQGPTHPSTQTEATAKTTEGKQIKLSGKAQKAIIDLQNAVNKADYANVPAKLAAAKAVASTADDKYAIGQLALKAALAQKDNNAMAAAIDTIATSGFVDAATGSKLYASLGTTLYNAKEFAPAAAAFQKAVAIDPNNVEVYSLLGEAKFAQGQKAEAAADFQRAVQLQTAGGQKPSPDLIKRAVSVAYDARSPLAVQLGREWVAAYPSPESWRNAIAIYRNMNHPDVEGTLDLLRLMQATGALTTAGDYALFAEASADQMNFNEAQAVIDAGIAAKLVDPTSARFKDIVSGLKGKPKATAADLEEALKMSPSTTNLLRIGDRYYGMGDYAKAAEIYRQVLAKPDADKEIANLHLGFALARAGDKAGATAALNAVTGPRADIAKYWLVYVKQHA